MPERWDMKKTNHVKSPPEVEQFLSAIEEVCRMHGFSISHEDGHGAFIITRYDHASLVWLNQAFLNLE